MLFGDCISDSIGNCTNEDWCLDAVEVLSSLVADMRLSVNVVCGASNFLEEVWRVDGAESVFNDSVLFWRHFFDWDVGS